MKTPKLIIPSQNYGSEPIKRQLQQILKKAFELAGYTEEDIKFTDKTDSVKSSYYVEYVIDSVIADLQKDY